MDWWKKILKSLMSFDDGPGIDLFKYFPGIRRFLAARHHYALLRTLGDVLFVLVVVSGFLGPQDADANFSVYLTWGLLWPAIVLSWFFVGRMWCGICPFPGLGVFLQKKGLSLNLPVPKWLQDYGVYMSVFLLGLIIWVEVVAGLDQWPRGTSYLVLSIVFGSALFAVLYPGQAWCRHLCPLGRMTGAAATMSITEFRANNKKCRGCKTIACKRGNAEKVGCPVYLGAISVKHNLHCLVCGHCLPLCDRDSPQLLLRNPYIELIKNQGRYITCTYIVPFLMGSQLARFLRDKPIYTEYREILNLPDALVFSVILILCSFFVLWLIKLGARLFGVDNDPICGHLSPMVPVLIPMAFTGELVYRMEFFADGLGNFIPTIGRQFHLDFLEQFYFKIPEFPVDVLSAFFMMNAVIAGGYILWRFAIVEFSEYLDMKSFIGINFIICALLFCYLAVIF